ncbi:MAG: hypothetical protein ACI4LE_02735 [Faecalibacterium sp.]
MMEKYDVVALSAFAVKPGREARQTTPIQKASIPNTGDFSSEKITAQRDAFWAGALESDSMLLWIATHLPNPGQSPFL